MSRPVPQGYTRTQIVLHWLVLLLVVLQFALNEAISEAFRAIMRGQDWAFSALIAQHVVTGVLILGLVIWRIVIKLRRGAPALPENEPMILKFAAHATHLALYGLLILLPISGLVAWFGQVGGAADAHEVLKTILILLVVLHFCGALAQQFVLKSDVFTRMRKPAP